MEIVQEEGTGKVKRSTDFYSLDAIPVVHRVSAIVVIYLLTFIYLNLNFTMQFILPFV